MGVPKKADRPGNPLECYLVGLYAKGHNLRSIAGKMRLGSGVASEIFYRIRHYSEARRKAFQQLNDYPTAFAEANDYERNPLLQ